MLFGASPAILPNTSEPTEHNRSICLFKNLYNFLQKCLGCSDMIQQHRAPSLVQQGALTVNLFYTQLVLVWRCCCWGWCVLWLSISAVAVAHQEMPPWSPFSAGALHKARGHKRKGPQNIQFVSVWHCKWGIERCYHLFWKLAFLLFLSLPERISSGADAGHKEGVLPHFLTETDAGGAWKKSP